MGGVLTEMDVKFKYGTWQKFQQISEKDPGTLYFLDNAEVYKGDMLLNSIRAVWNSSTIYGPTDENGFPITTIPAMRNKFFISLNNGEIRFVDDDLDYVSVTELALDSLLINQEFLQQLMAALADTQNIIMPTLTVDGEKLVWTESNVDSIAVFVPKQ